MEQAVNWIEEKHEQQNAEREAREMAMKDYLANGSKPINILDKIDEAVKLFRKSDGWKALRREFLLDNIGVTRCQICAKRYPVWDDNKAFSKNDAGRSISYNYPTTINFVESFSIDDLNLSCTRCGVHIRKVKGKYNFEQSSTYLRKYIVQTHYDSISKGFDDIQGYRSVKKQGRSELLTIWLEWFSATARQRKKYSNGDYTRWRRDSTILSLVSEDVVESSRFICENKAKIIDIIEAAGTEEVSALVQEYLVYSANIVGAVDVDLQNYIAKRLTKQIECTIMPDDKKEYDSIVKG